MHSFVFGVNWGSMCYILLSQAYLQARVVNTSPYPLLPSPRVSLFIDGCFVTTTKVKHVSPGEGTAVSLSNLSRVMDLLTGRLCC